MFDNWFLKLVILSTLKHGQIPTKDGQYYPKDILQWNYS